MHGYHEAARRDGERVEKPEERKAEEGPDQAGREQVVLEAAGGEVLEVGSVSIAGGAALPGPTAFEESNGAVAEVERGPQRAEPAAEEAAHQQRGHQQNGRRPEEADQLPRRQGRPDAAEGAETHQPVPPQPARRQRRDAHDEDQERHERQRLHQPPKPPRPAPSALCHRNPPAAER
jgi:hypothetical protein